MEFGSRYNQVDATEWRENNEEIESTCDDDSYGCTCC